MSDGGRGPPPKVARVIDAYDLDGLGERLEARWTAEDGESLRALADFFNERVLSAAVDAANARPLDRDVEVLYQRLTDGDVSEGVRTRTRRTLEREGIDVEGVTDDFVSHQSIHTYLREYRDAEKPEPTPEEKQRRVSERVRKLRNRTAAVSEDAIASLQREGLVPEGDVDVLVDVRVLYRDSGEQYEIGDLLED